MILEKYTNIKNMSVNPAMLELFLSKLQHVMKNQLHVNPTSQLNYRQPACLKPHITTTNEELGEPFNGDQLGEIEEHLSTYIVFSALRSRNGRVPCIVSSRILGEKQVIVDGLMTILT